KAQRGLGPRAAEELPAGDQEAPLRFGLASLLVGAHRAKQAAEVGVARQAVGCAVPVEGTVLALRKTQSAGAHLVVHAEQEVRLAQHARGSPFASRPPALEAAQQRAAPSVRSAVAERAEERHARSGALRPARHSEEGRVERGVGALAPGWSKLQVGAFEVVVEVRVKDAYRMRPTVQL